MAYMSKEHAATIRKNLKVAYPHIKFSVSIHHSMSINVCIMESPLSIADIIGNDKMVNVYNNHYDINHYYLHEYASSDLLKGIYEIINEGNFDESDSQTDYFHVGFYVNMSIGKWDKPYKQVN